MYKLIPPIAILVLAAFLRLYRLPDLFVFGGDEEYQATLALTLVKDFHIIWIGVTAGHIGFYLGPFWTYFTSFWLFLSEGNPLILGQVSSLIGVFTTMVILYIGSKLFNKTTALIAGLLYATLPLNVFFDQKYWNPSMVPLLSLVMLFSLSQIRINSKWWLVFFLCFGLVFHTHLSLVPFGLIAIYFFITKKINHKKFFLGVLIFLVIYSPLIIFDYFHKGSNITAPLRLKEFSSAPSVSINPKRHFEVLFQTLGRIWYLNTQTSNADNILFSCSPFAYLDQTSNIVDEISTRTKPYFWISFLSLILILWFVAYSLKKNDFNIRLLASAIFLITSSYLFLPLATHEYYLLGIFPLVLFLPGILITLISKQIIKKALLILILISSILGILTIITTTDDFGLKHKQKLISKILNLINSDSFEIDQSGICHQYGGWRYLFKIIGRLPERSFTDQGLGWLYPDEITREPAKYKVIFHEVRVPLPLGINIDKSTVFTEGGFKAYVFKSPD